jgi:galactokinase
MQKCNSRVCLAGEDLDWCGLKTLQLPISLSTTATMTLTDSYNLKITSRFLNDYKSIVVSEEIIENWQFSDFF